MSRRKPGPAPQIPDFTFVELLGSGGFADVFLYQQHHPNREVAVKVLRAPDVDDRVRQLFVREADLMAIANHPHIVTIFDSGITQDQRPYLVMEVCPRPNLGVRYRRERFRVTEALTVGIQVAGAVETVHRAGILHRDLKPANILVNEYDIPVLTDFGISTAAGDDSATSGFSMPWAPPEVLRRASDASVASDVYALAATLYTLLAGRPPFEIPGGDNGPGMVARIENRPLPPLNRPDVPPSLERVLATAMAKQPHERYPSAMSLARALQQVQDELQLPVTPIQVREEMAQRVTTEPDDDEPGTRIRDVLRVESPPPDPPGPAAPAPTAAASPARQAPTAAASRSVAGLRPWAARQPAPEVPAETVLRQAVPALTQEQEEPADRRRRVRGVVVGTVVGILAVSAVAVGLLVPERDAADPVEPVTAAPVDAVGTIVPPVDDLTGTVTGEVVSFTWDNPDPADGDVYLWQVARSGEGYQSVTEPAVDLPRSDDGDICIEVLLRRANGTASAPVEECAQP